MARKIRYYYDEESCTFQEEKISASSVIRYVLSLFSLSGILALAGLTIYFFAYDNPKEALLKSENAALLAQVERYKQDFSNLESKVDDLHKKDNATYRSMLGADEISAGVWNGGKGGSANFSPGDQPEVLQETEKRLEQLRSKVELQNKSYEVLMSMLKDKEEELRHLPSVRPVRGEIISGFGMRMHPIHKIRKMHTGLDMQATSGTPVHACADGIVKVAGVSRGGYGIQVHIEHGDFGYESKYAHLSKVKVRKGEYVKRGQVIGWSGNTGLSKGPHLHYEIVKGGKKINPIDYFTADLTPSEYVKAREQAKVQNMSMD